MVLDNKLKTSSHYVENESLLKCDMLAGCPQCMKPRQSRRDVINSVKVARSVTNTLLERDAGTAPQCLAM